MELKLPRRQERKGSDRDKALMGLYPERAKRVVGWLGWPLTREEIAGVRWFLETGDENGIPDAFKASAADGADWRDIAAEAIRRERRR